jgi:hypothetical protein
MKRIVFIIIVIACFACGDRYVNYTMYIDNRTSDTIKIVFFNNSPYAMITADSLFFPPLRKKLLYGAEGEPLKDGCYTGIKEEDVKIYSISGKKYEKILEMLIIGGAMEISSVAGK